MPDIHQQLRELADHLDKLASPLTLSDLQSTAEPSRQPRPWRAVAAIGVAVIAFVSILWAGLSLNQAVPPADTATPTTPTTTMPPETTIAEVPVPTTEPTPTTTTIPSAWVEIPVPSQEKLFFGIFIEAADAIGWSVKIGGDTYQEGLGQLDAFSAVLVSPDTGDAWTPSVALFDSSESAAAHVESLPEEPDAVLDDVLPEFSVGDSSANWPERGWVPTYTTTNYVAQQGAYVVRLEVVNDEEAPRDLEADALMVEQLFESLLDAAQTSENPNLRAYAIPPEQVPQEVRDEIGTRYGFEITSDLDGRENAEYGRGGDIEWTADGSICSMWFTRYPEVEPYRYETYTATRDEVVWTVADVTQTVTSTGTMALDDPEYATALEQCNPYPEGADPRTWNLGEYYDPAALLPIFDELRRTESGYLLLASNYTGHEYELGRDEAVEAGFFGDLSGIAVERFRLGITSEGVIAAIDIIVRGTKSALEDAFEIDLAPFSNGKTLELHFWFETDAPQVWP